MRSSPPKRKANSARRKRLSDPNRHLFLEAARRQLVCAVCKARGQFQAHHVVYEQHLRERRLPIYDTQNALRLCRDCHTSHHGRVKTVPTRVLTRHNITYAFTVFGVAAYDYFCRYYDNSERDERIEAGLERALEELAS
jgi:hypothetical protein